MKPRPFSGAIFGEQRSTVPTDTVDHEWEVSEINDCWCARTTKSLQMMATSTITIQSATNFNTGQKFVGGKGADVDFISQMDYNTHEDWHEIHDETLLNSTYVELENWSESYVSSFFEEESFAEIAATVDYIVNRANVENKYLKYKNKTKYHVGRPLNPGVKTTKMVIRGGRWFDSFPDWGRALELELAAIEWEKFQTPGDCEK